jgi:CBS domain containing-hemolysin-like protein
MTLLFVYVALALGVSFVCSVMEAALLTATPGFVALSLREGRYFASHLAAMKREIDRPLVAILTLNTIANTAGAAGAGAQAAAVLGDVWLGAFSAGLTLAILIVSEIIPKTLGAIYWKRLIGVVVTLLRAVILVLFPLVWVLVGITKLLSRGKRQFRISRQELNALAELGYQQGVLEEGELEILGNLFRFSSLTAADVMTPRTVVVAFPETQTVGEALRRHDTIRFSRIPIFEGSIDNITGYVLKDRLLLEAAQDQEQLVLSALKREIHVVPLSVRLPRVFGSMVQRRDHIVLVVDEYGGTAGVLTMEDIVETLLGLEIVDEMDSVADLRAHARRQWRTRAREMGLAVREPAEE